MAVVISVAVVLLYGPSVSMALTGDTYQWVQHAHAAAHDPLLLLADLDNFFRPSATWLLVVDRIVWGGFDAAGYRTTSLVLHAVTALLLGIAGRRLGLGWWAAVAVAMVWATSPFTAESVLVIACRHELLLLVPWSIMIIIWPRSGEPWSGRRVAAVGLMVAMAAAAKETWVVTPALVAALEVERTRSWRAAVMPTAIAGLAVVAYLIAHAALLHGSEAYLELGSHVLAKLPSQAASFLYLAEPMVDRFSITWAGVVGLLLVTAVAVSCVRWRVSGALVAIALLVAPSLPTLAVPYMPLRYLTIPYAGFVLLIALWLGGLADRRPRWRLATRIGGTAAVLAVVAAGSVVTRGDLEDYRFIAAAHARLLSEAGLVRESVGQGSPVLVVRDEQMSPLHDVAASPAGLPKILFVRNHDPYGLIDAAALFEWVLADETVRVEHVPYWQNECDGLGGAVLVHRDGGFVDPGWTPDVAAEARRWQSAGRGVQVVRRVVPS
jgi:hypothetical protein